MIRNTKTSWGSVSRWFHWGLGLAILLMIAYGWWMNHIPVRADRFFYRSIHANIGYAILFLMLLRLIWRAVNPVPRRLASTRKAEKLLGFRAQVGLEEGLSRLVRWWQLTRNTAAIA